MAGLHTLRTQLLPRQTLQPGLRVGRRVVKFDPVPQLSNLATRRLRAEESTACK